MIAGKLARLPSHRPKKSGPIELLSESQTAKLEHSPEAIRELLDLARHRELNPPSKAAERGNVGA